MKLIKELSINELAGEYIAVPVGGAAEKFKGVIRLNNTGKDIIEGLMDGLDEDAVADRLLEKYDGVDKETAIGYVKDIIARLTETGLIEE